MDLSPLRFAGPCCTTLREVSFAEWPVRPGDRAAQRCMQGRPQVHVLAANRAAHVFCGRRDVHLFFSQTLRDLSSHFPGWLYVCLFLLLILSLLQRISGCQFIRPIYTESCLPGQFDLLLLCIILYLCEFLRSLNLLCVILM